MSSNLHESDIEERVTQPRYRCTIIILLAPLSIGYDVIKTRAVCLCFMEANYFSNVILSREACTVDEPNKRMQIMKKEIYSYHRVTRNHKGISND